MRVTIGVDGCLVRFHPTYAKQMITVMAHLVPKNCTLAVDDSFLVIGRDQVLNLKERLNSVFPGIQIMMESGKKTNIWSSLMSSSAAKISVA
ncbi:unnamed protein product [Dibothriocephalus latus]|uniref:Uncharacterized protein n=1 Tax=Dibothriocephalus latus TaxID=60516 RepID=A0A3P7KWQ6_DIBLA|nr:unnamed protein product [Dibothriocephalus latus]